MFTKSGLTLAAAFGIVLLTAGAADAQILTLHANYTAGGAGRPDTTQPSGYYSTPIYPNGDGGKWRVKVNYGGVKNGVFVPFTIGDNPGDFFSATIDVGRGVNNQTWGIPGAQNWPNGIGPDTYVRAILQRSTDGGTTWKDQGQPAYDKCKP